MSEYREIRQKWSHLDKRLKQVELKLGIIQPVDRMVMDAPDEHGYTVLWTDGGCIRNGFATAVGAWAWSSGDNHGSGPLFSESHWWVTNNKAEAIAAIKGLQSFLTGARILLKTDSKILIAWIDRVNRNRGFKGCAIDNDIAYDLTTEVQKRVVRTHWVRGHNGEIGNEWCDEECQRLITEAEAQ